MKVWERIIEARLRDRVEISKQQYGFMPGKGTTDAMFALGMLMEKYREGQRELHCVFVDLEKAYDRVPQEELWYCMLETETRSLLFIYFFFVTTWSTRGRQVFRLRNSFDCRSFWLRLRRRAEE